MHRVLVVLSVFVILSAGVIGDAHADFRFGGGIHYLRTVGDLKDADGFDENAIGFLGSAKFSSPMITVEGDLEFIPDYHGNDELMIQPQAYVFVGNVIYGGVGIGVGHLGDFGWQDPFYALRAGVDLSLDGVQLDVFASYRFQKSDDLSGLGSDDLDAITFGAIVFFGM